MNDNSSLAHTKSYSVRTEIQKKIFYGEHREEIGKILRELCNWKQVNIVQAEVCPDHNECFGFRRISQRKKHINNL